MKARRTAVVTSELSVTDRTTRKEVHRDSRQRRRRLPKNTNDTGGPYAEAHYANGVTLCLAYQTVRVDIGVKLPWPVSEPGSTESANELRVPFDLAYQFVDDELASRMGELEDLLRKIAKKYGQR